MGAIWQCSFLGKRFSKCIVGLDAKIEDQRAVTRKCFAIAFTRMNAVTTFRRKESGCASICLPSSRIPRPPSVSLNTSIHQSLVPSFIHPIPPKVILLEQYTSQSPTSNFAFKEIQAMAKFYALFEIQTTTTIIIGISIYRRNVMKK